MENVRYNNIWMIHFIIIKARKTPVRIRRPILLPPYLRPFLPFFLISSSFSFSLSGKPNFPLARILCNGYARCDVSFWLVVHHLKFSRKRNKCDQTVHRSMATLPTLPTIASYLPFVLHFSFQRSIWSRKFTLI